MANLMNCLIDQLGADDVKARLKASGWDDTRIAAATDIDVNAAMEAELTTREVSLYRTRLNAVKLNELNNEFTALLDNMPTTKKDGTPIAPEKLRKNKADLSARWLAGLLTPDYKRGGLSATPSVDQLRGGYIALAHAALNDLTHAIAPNTVMPAAFRGKKLIDVNRDIAAYLHGDSKAVDPELAAMLDQWLAVADGMRQRANLAGADIPKLEGWGLRHSWSQSKVSKLTREQYIEDMVATGRLDRKRMAGDGQGELTEGQLRAALGEVYDGIVSNGMAKRKPSTVELPGIIAKRNGEARELHFLDGEAWFAAAGKYGEGQPDDAILRSMYHYIEDLAGDIALMERLGPSAVQNFKYMADVVTIASEGRNARSVTRSIDTLRSLARQDRSVIGWLNSSGAALRSYQVFSKLPAAFLASATDFGFTAVTAQQYGASMGRIMGNYAQLMSGMGVKEAQALGLTADYLSRTINRTTRYGDKFGAGAMGKLADFTMKASLLERHTLMGQLAFQMEINRTLGTHADKALADLPARWPEFFTHYGLNEGDWDALRVTLNSDGMLDPTRMSDPRQSARVLGAFSEEVRYAFYEPNVRERSMLTQGTTAGTVGGEFMRAVSMFKSFPIGTALLHWGRIAGLDAMQDKLTYAGMMVGMTTMLGGLSLMAKEIAKGRTVPDMASPEFALKAFLQGGSGGIAMDIVAKEHMSAAQLTQDLAGPVFGDLLGGVVAMQKASSAMAAGEGADRLTSDTIALLEKSTPGANLWWMRALITNKAFDMLNQHIDPLYADKRAGMKGWLKQRGQELTY